MAPGLGDQLAAGLCDDPAPIRKEDVYHPTIDGGAIAQRQSTFLQRVEKPGRRASVVRDLASEVAASAAPAKGYRYQRLSLQTRHAQAIELGRQPCCLHLRNAFRQVADRGVGTVIALMD